MIHAADFTVLGGSTGTQSLMKVARTMEMAALWGIGIGLATRRFQ